MMMSVIYMMVIFIIYFSYIPEAKAKEIERILTRVESVMPIYKSTTQATLSNIKETQHEFEPSGYMTHRGKKLGEGNENKKNVVRVTSIDTNLTIKCDSWNSLNNNSVSNESKQNKNDISDLYDCDNVTKTLCLKVVGESEQIHESEVICRTHSNHNSALCLHNSINSCSGPFTIILNLGSIFRIDLIGRQEPYYHNITVIKINEQKNRPVITITSPVLYKTSPHSKMTLNVQGLFDYDIMLLYNNISTVLDKGYDKWDSTIEQQVGYMPNDFQMEITIKMNAVISTGRNIIHVTEVKIRNFTDQPNNSSIERKENYYKECTFDNGLCPWVILSEINQTCQFEVASGLDAALSKRKALNDHSNNSFVGQFLYVHARTMCYNRKASFRTMQYQYKPVKGNATCTVTFAVIGTLFLRLSVVIPMSKTIVSLWNQTQIFDEWTVTELIVPEVDDTLAFYLQFDTVRSTDIYRDYIALDDISFSEGCLFEESSDIQVMKVGGTDDRDSLEVIIPVFASAAFMAMVLGTIAVITKLYGRHSLVRKGQHIHSSPVKWTCLETSDTISMPSISLTNFCHIEEFLTKKNPNYEWYSGRLLNNKLTDIPRGKLTISNKIGNGAFGDVYSGIMLQDYPLKKCRHVAVKTVLQGSSEKARVDFFLEALTLSKFSHPNIVEFLGVSVEKNAILLVLEYMPGGDLKNYLRNLRSGQTEDIDISSSRMMNMCIDVARACKYLEEIKFVHRDIAARNCLLTSKRKDIVVKLADFGLARDILSSDYYRKTGSAMLPVRWMSPESFSEGMFSSKSDVWSFGVLMWEIFSYAQMPYEGYSNTNVITLILTGRRLDKPALCKQKVYDLMCLCWTTDPTDRPSFSELLSHLEAIKQLQNNEIHRTPKIYVRQKKYNTYTSDEFESSPLTSTIRN